jgi:hypothetical protein
MNKVKCTLCGTTDENRFEYHKNGTPHKRCKICTKPKAKKADADPEKEKIKMEKKIENNLSKEGINLSEIKKNDSINSSAEFVISKINEKTGMNFSIKKDAVDDTIKKDPTETIIKTDVSFGEKLSEALKPGETDNPKIKVVPDIFLNNSKYFQENVLSKESMAKSTANVTTKIDVKEGGLNENIAPLISTQPKIIVGNEAAKKIETEIKLNINQQPSQILTKTQAAAALTTEERNDLIVRLKTMVSTMGLQLADINKMSSYDFLTYYEDIYKSYTIYANSSLTETMYYGLLGFADANSEIIKQKTNGMFDTDGIVENISQRKTLMKPYFAQLDVIPSMAQYTKNPLGVIAMITLMAVLQNKDIQKKKKDQLTLKNQIQLNQDLMNKK